MLIFSSVAQTATNPNLSNFGTLLTGVGTLILAIVAIVSINRWKIQKLYNDYKEVCNSLFDYLLYFSQFHKAIFKDLNNWEKYMEEMDHQFEYKIKPQQPKLSVSKEEVVEKLESLKDKFTICKIKLKALSFKLKNWDACEGAINQLGSNINELEKAIKAYEDYFNDYLSDDYSLKKKWLNDRDFGIDENRKTIEEIINLLAAKILH